MSDAATTQPDEMSKREVCEFLGKSKRTIDRYMTEGLLQFRHVKGRNGWEAAFPREAVEAFKRHEHDPPLTRAVTRVDASEQDGNRLEEISEARLPDGSRAANNKTGLVTHEALDALAHQDLGTRPGVVGTEARSGQNLAHSRRGGRIQRFA